MNAPYPCRARSQRPPLPPRLAKLDQDPDESEYVKQLAKSITVKVRPHNMGKPPFRWSQIMEVMNDGRERTADDVAKVTGMGRNNAQVTLASMVRAGLLEVDAVERLTIYKRAT